MKNIGFRCLIRAIFKKLIVSTAFALKKIKANKGKAGIHYNVARRPGSSQRKVLFSYLSEGLEKKESELGLSTRGNESLILINEFIRRGYSLDIVDGSRGKDLSAGLQNYDVVFGYGDIFRSGCEASMAAKKILYLTEKPPAFSLEKEQERIDYYYRRHGWRPPVVRSGRFYMESDFSMADVVIYIGSRGDKRYFPLKVPAFDLFPTSLKNEMYVENYLSRGRRRNFLWIGSLGALHKGLDILVDVFSSVPGYYLHIMGLGLAEYHVVSHALRAKNILNYGFVRVDSPQFLNVIYQCGYVIMPSCSEGVSTSVLTGMRHGLVPIVTHACSIDIDGLGFLIEDYSIPAVKNLVESCGNISEAEFNIKSMSAKKYAEDNATLVSFSERVINIFDELEL